MWIDDTKYQQSKSSFFKDAFLVSYLYFLFFLLAVIKRMWKAFFLYFKTIKKSFSILHLCVTLLRYYNMQLLLNIASTYWMRSIKNKTNISNLKIKWEVWYIQNKQMSFELKMFAFIYMYFLWTNFWAILFAFIWYLFFLFSYFYCIYG